MVNPIEQLKETKQELKHVVWPSRREAIVFTIIVVATSLFVAAFLGFFDYTFTQLLNFVI